MTRIPRRAFMAVMSFLVALVAALAMPAAAAPAEVIVLPGASSAEGIANGGGTTFYAGDLFTGDIFRGDVQRGTAQLFIDAPVGRMAVGMKVDISHDLLFVAGGFTGQGYVYNTVTGATVATYQFGAANRFVPAEALLRSGRRGRSSGVVLHIATDWAGGRDQRPVQPQWHSSDVQRQGAHRGALDQWRALYGRSGHRCQRGYRRSERSECRRHSASGQTAMGGAEQQPGDKSSAKPGPHLRGH
jgi:hypothetical protein